MQEGYDAATRTMFLGLPVMEPLDETVTREEALTALWVLKDLLVEFPFTDEAGRAVALSGIISGVLRPSLTMTPLHLFVAPTPGSGKSFLMNLIAVTATGEKCA